MILLGCFFGQQCSICRILIYCVCNGIHGNHGGRNFTVLSSVKEEAIVEIEFLSPCIVWVLNNIIILWWYIIYTCSVIILSSALKDFSGFSSKQITNIANFFLLFSRFKKGFVTAEKVKERPFWEGRRAIPKITKTSISSLYPFK